MRGVNFAHPDKGCSFPGGGFAGLSFVEKLPSNTDNVFYQCLNTGDFMLKSNRMEDEKELTFDDLAKILGGVLHLGRRNDAKVIIVTQELDDVGKTYGIDLRKKTTRLKK